eukprot:TRINITY_DN376_c0_g1_i2.p1 TRINITY_DN376_c0_g1~~TRINITY_DN376_c0_g1_i2.p1  ORF type:complete len:107 (+),score=29.94 TRINITY_DN376_c0_g1_i2:612-932(+)
MRSTSIIELLESEDVGDEPSLNTVKYLCLPVNHEHSFTTTCSRVMFAGEHEEPSSSITSRERFMAGIPSPYSALIPVSYTHLRAHETPEHLVCRLLLEKKKKKKIR